MPPHMTEPVTCPHMDLIGKTKDEVDFNQIKEPHRVIPPGAAVTMDYSPDRVNFQLDENGRIVRIWCG
ncbi:MAG: hypothetical protein H6865_08040 [Rhodospirillales bacterium]|nr:hypothetical protein [Alphaproteobacteria bacterium]MCB9987566.1 hypothetical protein [Rhodospirillales bacterium]USO08530.1 MAG: hypothetical protein H6866_00310 [Rhodospirillales bacterium]